MRNANRRMVRLVTAVGLAGAILLGPAGIGGAQVAAQENNSFAGTSTGYALRVTLDLSNSPLLPVLEPVLSAAGVENGIIDQYFVRTTSDADSNGVHRARSVLAEGLIDLDFVEASAIGQVVEHTLQELDGLPLISGGVGELKAAVAQGPAVAGNGVLHQLGVDIGDIIDLGILEDAGLDALIQDLEDTLNDLLEPILDQLVTQVVGTLGLEAVVDEILDPVCDLGLPLLPEVCSIVDPSDEEVVGGLTELLSVSSVLGILEQLLVGGLTDGLLANVTGLVNNTAAWQLDSGEAVARSGAVIEEIGVLGGLVDVGLFNLFSRSEAAGTPGSAKNTSDCSIADVSIGGDTLALSLDGSSITINGEEVPLVGDLVAQVKSLVDGILAGLGIEVGLCETAKVEADPQGRSASQSVSALRVAVAPLGLFSLVIDPTVQTAVSVQPQAAPAAPTAEVQLPTTGAAHLATALSGMALLGAALLFRRRLIS